MRKLILSFVLAAAGAVGLTATQPARAYDDGRIFVSIGDVAFSYGRPYHRHSRAPLYVVQESWGPRYYYNPPVVYAPRYYDPPRRHYAPVHYQTPYYANGYRDHDRRDNRYNRYRDYDRHHDRRDDRRHDRRDDRRDRRDYRGHR